MDQHETSFPMAYNRHIFEKVRKFPTGAQDRNQPF